MKGVWRKVWPECIKDFMGFEPELPTLHNEIAKMANEVGFHEVTAGDIKELLNSHRES